MLYSLNIGIGGSKLIGAIMLLSKLDRSGVGGRGGRGGGGGGGGGGGEGHDPPGVTEAHTVKMW